MSVSTKLYIEIDAYGITQLGDLYPECIFVFHPEAPLLTEIDSQAYDETVALGIPHIRPSQGREIQEGMPPKVEAIVFLRSTEGYRPIAIFH